jgi:signal transduction histidine kinase
LVEQTTREADEDQVNFVINVNGEKIVGDENAIHQALRNYVDNAVKFSHKFHRGSKSVDRNTEERRAR